MQKIKHCITQSHQNQANNLQIDDITKSRNYLFLILIHLLLLATALILNQNGLFALPATEPTTPYFVQSLGHHPGNPGSALFVNDTNLYMGFQQELTIFDATSETNPTPLTSLFFQATINEIVVVNNRAYILTFDGLHILDVTNPETAVEMGYTAMASSSTFKIVEETAYILGYEGDGLYIVDVSNPFAPTQTGFYDTSSRAVIGVQNQTLFLLENTYDDLAVQAFSLVDPSHPQPTISYRVEEDSTVISAVLTNGYLYLLTQTTAGCGLGGCSYVSHLRILTTDTLVELAKIDAPHSSQMKIINNYIYFLHQDGSPTDDLSVWELTTPPSAHQIGSQSIEGNVLNFVVDAQNLYASIESFGLQRINMTDPTTPQPSGSYQAFNLKEIALSNDMTTLFALDGNAQFRILNLANPKQPSQLYSQAFQQFPYDNKTLTLTHVNEFVYLLWFDDSLSRFTLDIIDVTIPTNPTLMSRYPLPEPTPVYFSDFSRAQLQVIGNKAHLVIQAPLLQGGGYNIIDVENPTMPQQQEFWVSGDLLDGFVIRGDHAMLRTLNGLQLLNIADPTQFVDLGVQLTDRNFTVGPVAYQNLFYFGEWDVPFNESPQLSIFDASNLENLIEVNQQNIEGVPFGMWVAADELHISTSSVSSPIQENGGFYLYTLNDPKAPKYAAWLSAHVGVQPLTFDRTNNTIFTANPYGGLDIMSLLSTVSEQYLPVIMKHTSQ